MSDGILEVGFIFFFPLFFLDLLKWVFSLELEIVLSFISC